MNKSKLVFVFFSILAMIAFSPIIASAEYHHVDGCGVCHSFQDGTCSECSNIKGIKCNIGGKPVSFTTRTGTGIDDHSFANGDAIYDGVCEVCHPTTLKHHRNDGSQWLDPDYSGHYEGQDCIPCHNHTPNEFSHGGPAPGGCDPCHGHDPADPEEDGIGTYISHSTHTETDDDDVMGPNVECFECHDTSNYPYFADGATTLADTTVCDNCHSTGGAYGGAAMAKENWGTGVYESDGENLKLAEGKEEWCASCHDDDPAFSTSRLYQIVIDDDQNEPLHATFEGAWSTGSNTDQYANSVHWHMIGNGDPTATWRPNISYASEYSVYAWWTVHSNRATDAPYTVNYKGGSATFNVNQEVNGGKWNFLGTFPFAEGTDGCVVLSDNSAQTGQYVIADAVKFEIGPQGIYAPKVIGDNVTYGYYATGHGKNELVECLDCHDPSATHIDHDARTYDAGVTDYCDSYRLKQIDGQPAMDVPRSSGGGLANWQDFALCFECHDRYAVIGTNSADVSQTNFWDDDTSPNNSHWYHLGMTSVSDSDYDGTTDSSPTCTTCHNVHGSPTGPMIRHGELISPPGTTSYVPSFNFYYLIGGDGSATATFTPDLAGGMYRVYARWTVHPNRTTNAKYIINYNGGSVQITVDQEQNGDAWNLLGNEDGYPFAVGTAGNVVLTSDGANEYIMADAVGWDSDFDGIPDIIVDDADATYEGTWSSGTVGYKDTQHWYYAPILDENALAIESVGATMQSGGLRSNHACGT